MNRTGWVSRAVVRRVVALAAATIVAGCTGPLSNATTPSFGSSAPLVTPAQTRAAPSASMPAPSDAPEPSAAVSMSIEPCPATTPAGTLCLGPGPATVLLNARRGSTVTITLTVRNGGTTSIPIAMRLDELDGGPLPVGALSCHACRSTTDGGFEWPSLNPDEQEVLSVRATVTGSGQSVFFASLYAESLATVLANEAASGIVPGAQDWKVSLSIGS